MKKIYRLAIVGLLMRGITACSSETTTSSEPVRQPIQEAATADTALQSPAASTGMESRSGPAALPTPTVHAGRGANTSPVKTNSKLVFGSPARKTWRATDLKAEGYAKKNTPLVVKQPVAKAGYGTDNPTAPNLLALPLPGDIAVSNGAAPDNLQAYFAAALAPAQVFLIRSERDTVLLGQQGTVVAVPASAWELPAGGTVRLELREFYSTSDIILAGLSTRSGANLLETGGMVYMGATANEQPVSLRQGQRLLLRMPTTRKLDDMQFFQGVGTQPQHGPDWQLPPASAAKKAALATLEEERAKGFDLAKDGHWPQLPGSQNALLKLFDKQMPLPRTTLARLKRPRPTVSEDEKQLLKAYTKANHKKIIRAVRVQLNVDSTGALLTPTLLPNGDDEQGAAVLAVVQQLTKWHPARFRRLATPHRMEKINAAGQLTVLYTSAGKRLIGMQWDDEATQMPRIERYLVALEAKARLEGRQQFAAQFASSGPLMLDNKLYYEMEASGLGWMNCDRFTEQGPRIEFAVQTAEPNTVVTLVFQNQRSILASSRTEPAAAIFTEVPAGMAATIVAIRREKGVTYLATAAATLQPENQPILDFKPVSLEELRTSLAKL